ncbi:hypothetical protein F5Y09DRAFT_129961 [Xylaria sp. FL1042]|nr:hypothetical protein F5Y09DRAFT_129961 [Xylaria sp. FL1042]
MSQPPYRTGQIVCSSSCPIGHIGIPGDNIKEPEGSWPDIRGLNSLNYSRDKWLTGDAIEVSIATYCRGLPKALQDKISLGIPGINPKVWHMGPSGEGTLAVEIKASRARALKKIKATPFSIFPICTNGNHWVLVIICKSQPLGAKDWSHVRYVAVLDPFRTSTRIKMVNDRLRDWLIKGGNFTYGDNYNQDVWVPLQKDASSCGPRAYWNAKQLIDRLLACYEANIDYSNVLWKDLSGWFNDDFVRGEMMGRCAWAAVCAMDYNARIAVECVNRVRDYGSRDASWMKADKMMRPADSSEARPDKRPHGGGNIITLTPPASATSVPAEMPAGGRQFNVHYEAPILSRQIPPTPTPATRRNAVVNWGQHKLAPDAIPKDDVVIIDDSSDDHDDDADLPKGKGKRPAFSPRTPKSKTTTSRVSASKPVTKQGVARDFASSIPDPTPEQLWLKFLNPEGEVAGIPGDGVPRTPIPKKRPSKHIIELSDDEVFMRGPMRKRQKSR